MTATAREAKIHKVLLATGFSIGKKETRFIREQVKNGRRYFFMVGKRREGKKIVERFIKIPENNTRKLLEPFERQIEFAKYLITHRIIPTRRVIEANINPKKGTPYVIMETFPARKAKIGFIWRDRGSEKLGAREARSVFKSIEKLHSVRWATVPRNIQRLLKKSPGTYDEFKARVHHALGRRVLPIDAHAGRRETFGHLAAKRLARPRLRAEIDELLLRWKPVITDPTNHKPTLMHGDLAPNNFYVFDSGEVELLDYEWAGYSKNAALAMAFDIGHMRARAWASASFRKALDAAVLESYTKRGKKELGRAILSLGTLLFSTQMAGAFENYPLERQKAPREQRRRRITKREILKAWEF